MTLDQKRARYAWEEIAQVGQLKEYTALAKGFPSLVMNSGLMQSLAYLAAKGDARHPNHHDVLKKHVLAWLGRTLGGAPLSGNDRFPREPEADFRTVMTALHAAPSSLYFRATDETMALLRWVRQFADARKVEG